MIIEILMLGQLGLTVLVWASLKARQDKKIEGLKCSYEEEILLNRKQFNDYRRLSNEYISNSRNRISLLESDYTRVSNKLKRLTPAKPKTNTVNKTQTTKTKK
jgi:hypothetical protein